MPSNHYRIAATRTTHKAINKASESPTPMAPAAFLAVGTGAVGEVVAVVEPVGVRIKFVPETLLLEVVDRVNELVSVISVVGTLDVAELRVDIPDETAEEILEISDEAADEALKATELVAADGEDIEDEAVAATLEAPEEATEDAEATELEASDSTDETAEAALLVKGATTVRLEPETTVVYVVEADAAASDADGDSELAA